MSSDTRSAGAGSAPSSGGEALLSQLAALSEASFVPLLEEMFSHCDDFFFDLASRARSNQEQNVYFESLREVRQKKDALATAFTGRITAGFDSLAQAPAARPGARAATGAGAAKSLALVANEQLEKEVLLTDMVTKARLEWQQAILQLHERLQVVAGRRIADEDMPLEPGYIARSFAAASTELDLELRILKLVYKLFERHVVRRLEDLYCESNQLLVDARVLPNLAPLALRRKARPEEPDKPAPKAEAAAPATPSPSAFDLAEAEPQMQEVAQLLARLRSGGIKLPMFPAAAPGAPPAPPIPREELLGLLSDVQAQPAADGAEAKPLDIRQAIEAIVAARGNLSVGQADEDVINVVAMFFDLILDDRNLPLEIQALVSRLQLPILKVALRDRTFFTDRKHPARQLINEIARTSIGWDTSTKDAQDALFIRLTELVEEVLRSSADQTGIFEKCLTDLMGFIERNDQRSAKIERRTSEKAQAEARTAKARDMARHALSERLEGRELPAEVAGFLVGDWQQVLQLVHLKHGTESHEWMEAVQAVEDLVWSVQPHSDEKSLARRSRILPGLYERLEAGLLQTHSSAEDAAAQIDALRRLHASADSGDASAPELALAPLTPEQKTLLAPVQPADEKSWRDMTAVERQKVQYEALVYEYLKRVDEVPPGAWFEYDDLRRAVTRRCKLAARLEETQTFVFVNRLGLKVYEKPRKAFAYDLQMGHARPIEDAPLFDRTIERIAGNLRRLAGDAQA